jgi:hypothetical protein
VLIPPLMPPGAGVPVAHTSGPPATPRPPAPTCGECVDLGAALQKTQRAGDNLRGVAIRNRIVRHFEVAHA